MTATSVGPCAPAGAGTDLAAARSRSRTSSSVVWLKSQYDRPTAKNGDGVVAQTTSSTSAVSSWQVDCGAAGTATTILAGRCLAQGLDRRAHARTSGETVVDEDDGLSGEVGHGSAAPVGLLTAKQLAALLFGDPLDDLRGYPQAPDEVVIDDDYPATGDCPHSQLFAARHAELADHKDIQRSVQRPRDVVGHRHTTPRQPEDHHVRTPPVVL